MGIETTTDREKIPTLDENQLIRLDETRLTKVAQVVVGVVGFVGAGFLTWLGLTNDTIKDQDPGVVLLGAGVLLAVSVLAWSVVAAADIRARGMATAANLGLRARPNLTIAPPGASGKSAGLWVHIIGRESGDKHLVVDSRVVSSVTSYLLAREDETPTWYAEDKLGGWELVTSPDA